MARWSPASALCKNSLGGNYIMKNTMMKNLIKNMADYGEMLNRIGC